MRTETEFKFLFTDEASLLAVERALVARGVPDRGQVRQVNHFFDTEDRALSAAGLALRLREEAGRFLVTAKGRLEEAPAAGSPTRHLEEEAWIPAEVARTILTGSRTVLDVLLEASAAPPPLLARIGECLAGRAPASLGCFTNQRTRLAPWIVGGHELVVELDRTEFPAGRRDFELELEVEPEVTAEAHAALLELFRDTDARTTTAPTKAARFFAALAAAQGDPA